MVKDQGTHRGTSAIRGSFREPVKEQSIREQCWGMMSYEGPPPEGDRYKAAVGISEPPRDVQREAAAQKSGSNLVRMCLVRVSVRTN